MFWLSAVGPCSNCLLAPLFISTISTAERRTYYFCQKVKRALPGDFCSRKFISGFPITCSVSHYTLFFFSSSSTSHSPSGFKGLSAEFTSSNNRQVNTEEEEEEEESTHPAIEYAHGFVHNTGGSPIYVFLKKCYNKFTANM
jgi:hypothetical protein